MLMAMKTLACLALLACLSAACSSDDLKGEGEECFGTAECAPGLVCNPALTPQVCSLPSDQPPPDAAVEIPDAPPVPDAGQTPDAPPAPPPDAPPAPPPDAPLPDATVFDATVADA